MPEPCEQEASSSEGQTGSAQLQTDDKPCEMLVDSADGKTESTTPTPISTPPDTTTPQTDTSAGATPAAVAAAAAAVTTTGTSTQDKTKSSNGVPSEKGPDAAMDISAVLAAAAAIRPVADYRSYYNSLVDNIRMEKNVDNAIHELVELMKALRFDKFRGSPDDAKYMLDTVLPNAQRAVLRSVHDHNLIFIRFTAMFLQLSAAALEPLLSQEPTPENRERILSFLKLVLSIAQADLKKVLVSVDDFCDIAGPLLNEPDNAGVLSFDKYKFFYPSEFLQSLILLCHLEVMMFVIANNHGLCSFQHFHTIVATLSICCNSSILSPVYGRWKITLAAVNSVQSWIPRMTDDEIRNFDKELMDKCLRSVLNISHYYYRQTDLNEKVELLFLSFALRCINSGFIDKRVYGIGCLSTFIYSYNSQNPASLVLTKDSAARWILENSVLEFLLGPSAQTELVKETSSLVSFIFSRSDCPTTLLELTWNSVLSLHETISEAILKTLASCITFFTQSVFDFFVAKIHSVAPQDIYPRIISFYSALVTNVIFCENACEESLSFLTTLLLRNNLSAPVQQCAKETVQNIISSSQRHLQFDKWLDTFVSVIASHVYQAPVSEDALLFSFSSIESLLTAYGHYCYTWKTKDTKAHKALELLERECPQNPQAPQEQQHPPTFLAIIIREVMIYHNICFKRDGTGSVPCGSPAVAAAQPDGASQLECDNFQPRLAFLSWLLVISRTPLHSTDFSVIWSQLRDNFIASHVETFLSWVVQCHNRKFKIISDEDCLSLVNDMVSLAKLGKMTSAIFDNVSQLMLSLDHASEPSSVNLSLFSCVRQLFLIIFSLEDESVFRRGVRFLLSFCPLTTNTTQAQSDHDRESSLVSILMEYILYANSASGKESGDDCTLSPAQLARALEVFTIFLQLRNDPGYNSFSLPSSADNSEAPMTVYIAYCGTPVFAVETMSTETLGGLRRLVAKRLETFAQTLCLDKMTFFRNGVFFPAEGWSHNDVARPLKECGITDGAVLRVAIPEDISASENKLILRASGSAAISCDTAFNELDKSSDSANLKQLNPEEMSALVDQVCLKTKADRELVLFVLGHCKWDSDAATEVFENKEKLQEAQAAFEASKKNESPASGEQTNAASSGPSCIAKSLSEYVALFNALYSLLRSRDLSVSRAAWGLLQQIPVHPELIKTFVTAKFSPEYFSIAAPYFLSYNLHIVELVLSSPDTRDFIQCLVANGTLAYIASSVLPSLTPPPTPSLRDALATCIAIVTRGFGVADCPSITTAQSLEILRVVAEQSAVPASNDSAIVARVFALINACAAGNKKTITEMMPLFSSSNTEHSLLYKLLVDHSDVAVRQETAQGVLRIFSTLKGSDEESTKYRTFYLNRLECMIPLEPTPKEAEQSQQFFDLIEAICFMCAAAGQGSSNQSHARNMELYQQFVESHLPKWLGVLLTRPTIETFSQDASAKSCTGTDFFLAGIAKVVRCTLMLFPSLTGVFFGPQQVRVVLDDLLFHVDNTLSKDCLPKAKRNSTRAAVFDLLIEAAAHCADDARIISEYMCRELPTWANEYSNDDQCAKTWAFDPSRYTRSELGFVGLYNSGNLCYMNSVMQQLFHIPRLRRAILAIDVTKLTCSDKLRTFAEEFQKLFYFMEHSVQRQVNPRPFLSAFARVTEGFSETQQHDADEFLNILWQRLEQALKDTPQWEPLNAIFAGKVRHEIKSMDESLPYVRHTYEDFHVLSLDISDKKSLADALSFFIQPDRLSGENAYFCDKYNRKVDASKRAMLQHLPPVLAIHLKRFAYKPAEDRMVKLHERLEFPQDLSMEPYTVEDEADTSPRRFRYRLRGVVVHSGECQSGHYYSFVNTQSLSSEATANEAAGRSSNRTWLKFNDSEVDLFAENQLEHQCFGGTKTETIYSWNQPYSREVPKTNSAYMLFYERCDLSDAEQDAAPMVDSSDVCPTTELSDVMNSDNQHFIHEEYLSNHSLFFLLESLWSMHRHVCDPRTFVLLFLYVVCHSCVKEQFVSAWANHLCIMLRNDPEFAAWYVAYVQQNNIIRSHVLPSPPSEIVRVKVADTIIAAMNSAAPLEQHLWPRYKETVGFSSDKRAGVFGQKTPVLDMMDHLITLLLPCREHWQTFRQYFRLFHGFSKLGPNARTALMEARIGSLFDEWFNARGRYTAKVMNSSYFPDLRDFFSTLQTVWCGCYQGPNRDSSSPYACDGELVPPLPDFCSSIFRQSLLLLFITHPYNTAAIARMVCHYCYNDVAATRDVLATCIETFKSNGLERVPSNRIICAVLDINDSLRDARCNYLMTPYVLQDPSGTGLLGLLQLTLSRNDANFRADVELLHHCCTIPYGFTCALRYRSLVDWLDGHCVAQLARVMAADPPVFERLCLENDESVLATKEGSSYATSNLVIAFRLIRALVNRMDSMSESMREGDANFWRERQETLLRDALYAARENQPFLWQPEWQEHAVPLECGRVSPPEDPFADVNDAVNALVNLPSIPKSTTPSSCPHTPISNNKNYDPSPAEIDELVAQARDILGLDDETLRQALHRNHYDLNQTINNLL